MTPTDRTSLLFVCMGNICRSPLAEGVFLHLAREQELQSRFRVDSAGTGGWHSGEAPDERVQAIAKKKKVKLVSVARAIDPARDFKSFDWLIAMDRENVSDLLEMGAPESRVRLLRSFDPTLAGAAPEKLDVPDPYYGEAIGFEQIFELVWRACEGCLEEFKK